MKPCVFGTETEFGLFVESTGKVRPEPKDIAENAKVARPTVNQVLDKLLKLKKVERIGLGRSTRYRKL